MTQQSTNSAQINSPTNTVKEAHTITVDIDSFKPDLNRVKSEKTNSMLLVGFIGGLIGGLVGAVIGHRAPENKPLVITASAVAGIVAGGAIGKRGRTEEEARSESLMKAAKSGNFGEALKKEMKKREENAFSNGQLAGGGYIGH